MIKLRDTAGYTVIINEANWTHIAQAADQNSKQVLLNTSVVFFVNGNAVAVQGAPEEVKGQIESQQAYVVTQ
jgi:hypothetical protein